MPSSWTRRGDLLALAALLFLSAIVIANRVVFDGWLARHDIITFYLPGYTFLGEQLRAFDIPGWNPYFFSGQPFAGDPQSGWMFLPTMLTFPLFEPGIAFKITVAIELLIAGFATYAFARVVGLRPVPSLMAAVVFEFGPLLYHTTDCCTIRAQLQIWIPVSLLGVELALRALTWRGKVAAWFLAGFGISQMFAGWLGQGSLDGILVIGSYLGYRALLSPPVPLPSSWQRIRNALTVGAGMGVSALLLGAAGLLPRLEVNAATNLAGGNYDGVASGYSVGPFTPRELLSHVLMDDFGHREIAVGATAFLLGLLAPLLARRQFAVPYFAGLTLVVFVLTLDTTPLHRLFYLIPTWREFHEHYVPQTTAVVMIGPAMLAGATVQMLPSWRPAGIRRGLAFGPLAIFGLMAYWLWRRDIFVGWTAVGAAVGATLLIGIVAARTLPSFGFFERSILRFIPLLLVALAFIQTTGLELVDAATGSSLVRGWRPTWDTAPDREQGAAIFTAPSDPGGAGEFLQQQMKEFGPFRFVGYGGLGYPGDSARARNYTRRRYDPNVLAILVNGRSVFLDLFETQGYNPMQLKRYVDFTTAINGNTQDYHHANLRPAGVDSPLLGLLNVRYIVVDASLPADREDVAALTRDRREVFRNDLVVVYENPDALSAAWLVHEVTTVESPGESLRLVSDPAFQPAQQAIVEGEVLTLEQPPADAVESAQIVDFEPDRIVIRTQSVAAGLLVVSEIYADGWNAQIDGESADVVPTNHVLRGVPLPKGQHEVVLTYAPRSLQVGVVLSAASTVAMQGVFAFAALPLARRRSFAIRGSAQPAAA